MRPEYWVSGSVPPHSGSGDVGPHRFGPAPESLVFVITSRPPSGVTSTSAGYHELGMNPRTVRVARSTTATAFSPASVTYSVPPSGATARPTGLAPFGPPGTSPTAIVSSTAPLRESTTETVSEFALATYASSRAGLATTALGWSARSGSGESVTGAEAISVSVSITETLRPIQLVTIAVRPSGRHARTPPRAAGRPPRGRSAP